MTKERFKYLMDKLMLIVKKLGQLVEEKENRIKDAKRIAKKGGPSLLARVLAKAGLAGFSGALTGGLSTALMVGFVAKDLYDIANILAEEE